MKKGRFSKLIIILSVLLILTYTVSAIVLQFVVGVEVSATLTTCFYSFFGIEMLCLAGIKSRKVRYDYNYEENIENEVENDDC